MLYADEPLSSCHAEWSAAEALSGIILRRQPKCLLSAMHTARAERNEGISRGQPRSVEMLRFAQHDNGQVLCGNVLDSPPRSDLSS